MHDTHQIANLQVLDCHVAIPCGDACAGAETQRVAVICVPPLPSLLGGSSDALAASPRENDAALPPTEKLSIPPAY